MILLGVLQLHDVFMTCHWIRAAEYTGPIFMKGHPDRSTCVKKGIIRGFGLEKGDALALANHRAKMTSPSAPTEPKFGFVEFAEKWNGRMAMMGFTIGMIAEVATGNGILQQLGL
eukprot:g2430.t1